MSSVLDRDKRQSAFCMRTPHDTSAGSINVGIDLQTRDVALEQHFLDDLAKGFMVRDEEVVGGGTALEALLAAKRHVLDCGERAV